MVDYKGVIYVFIYTDMKLAPASGERTGEQGLFSFNKSNRKVLSDVVVFTFSRKNECQRLALQVHLYCQRLALQVLLLPALGASSVVTSSACRFMFTLSA
jgi:hypothetical protein